MPPQLLSRAEGDAVLMGELFQPLREWPRDASAADVLGAFVVPEPAAPPAAEPFCAARHAAEEDEFGAIAGRTAIR